MPAIERISPQDVLSAAKATGVALVQRVNCGNGRPGTGFFNFRKSCTEPPKRACALGALFLAQNQKPHYGEIDVQWWADRSFERSYRQGFAEGFDGDPPNEKLASDTMYSTGYDDGVAVAKAVFSPEAKR